MTKKMTKFQNERAIARDIRFREMSARRWLIDYELRYLHKELGKLEDASVANASTVIATVVNRLHDLLVIMVVKNE